MTATDEMAPGRSPGPGTTFSALLGLDLGTSEFKASVVNGGGEVLDVASAPYTVNAPRYDLVADRWAYEVLEYLDLPVRLLASLMESGQRARTLTLAAANELNLAPGTAFAVGASNTAAPALSAGLVDPSRVNLTVGTAAQILAPLLFPTSGPSRVTHLYRAATPHRCYAMAAVQNAGLAMEWALRALGADWKEAYEALEAIPPRTDLPCFLPYLTGERQDPTLREPGPVCASITDASTFSAPSLKESHSPFGLRPTSARQPAPTCLK